MMHDDEILKEFPQLKKHESRLETYSQRINRAWKERNMDLMSDSYTAIIETHKEIYKEMLGYYYDKIENNFEKIRKAAAEQGKCLNKAADQLKREREEYNKVLENLPSALLEDPIGAIQGLFDIVERKHKTESMDGFSNWQWEYGFSLKLRLTMALKLVFGKFKL